MTVGTVGAWHSVRLGDIRSPEATFKIGKNGGIKMRVLLGVVAASCCAKSDIFSHMIK